MQVSLQPRAIIFADDRVPSVIQILREFLFKLGYRQTICTTNPVEVSNLIHTSHWPLVIIDHTNGVNDGMQVFEGIYKILGHQLIPYVFSAPADSHIFQNCYQSIGAAGLLKKPLQIAEAERVLKSVIPKTTDPAVRLAHHVSKSMLQGNFASLDLQLSKLKEVPQFKRHAEIALLRVEMAQGMMSKANERFRSLLKEHPRDLRVLSEYADFLKRNSLYFNTLKCYQRIQSLHPELSFKFWDQVALHIELEQLDEAAQLLDSLQQDDSQKDLAAEALARMMYFMGLHSSIPNFIKVYPHALRNYNLFTGATPVKKVSSP